MLVKTLFCINYPNVKGLVVKCRCKEKIRQDNMSKKLDRYVRGMSTALDLNPKTERFIKSDFMDSVGSPGLSIRRASEQVMNAFVTSYSKADSGNRREEARTK
jgi:hypothetical protein